MIHALLLLVALVLVAGCQSAGNSSDVGRQDAAAGSRIGYLRHVVLFKFKAGTPPEKLAAIEEAFSQLPSKIPFIVDFEWGTNNSPEGLDLGYTHCYLVTFKDAKDRDAYLPHPEHKKFVELAKPYFDAVHVIDYVAAK